MNRRIVSALFAGALLACGLGVARAQDAPKKDAPKADASKTDRAALEKQFEETMSGAVLIGKFTTGAKDANPPKEEKYTITKVSKVEGDVWLFMARVQYGDHDVTVPMPLEVKWAGDTPVITLTDLTIPQMGTYTARVMIYRGQYAGTWQHGDKGGHLWGRIERAPAESEKPAEKKEQPVPKKDAK